MLKKVQRNLMAMVVMLGLALPVALPAQAVFADASTDAACAGIGLTSGSQCGPKAENRVNNFLGTIVNILSVIVGAVAVIMVIVAGFKYTTAGGDSNNISSAKNTLVYALVGLAIVALAQTIVRFVFKIV